MSTYVEEKHRSSSPKEAPIDHYAHEGPHDEEVGVVHKGDPLKKDLKSRHMQMIAIGKLSR